MKAVRTAVTSASRCRFHTSTYRHNQLPGPFPPSRCLHSRGQVFSSSLAVREHADYAESSVLQTPKTALNDPPYPTRNGKRPPEGTVHSLSDCRILDQLSPLRRYRSLVKSGVLRSDDHQTRIIETLQQLHDNLLDYDPPMIPELPSSNSLVSLCCFHKP